MIMTDKQLIDVVDKAIKAYKGDTRCLSNAICYLFMRRKLGWRITLPMHDRKSIKDYETILGVDSKDVFSGLGPVANKSLAQGTGWAQLSGRQYHSAMDRGKGIWVGGDCEDVARHDYR